MKCKIKFLVLIFCSAILCRSCAPPDVSDASLLEQNVVIFPDYTDIMVPPNIAPLNFRIDSEGDLFLVNFIGETGYSISVSTTKNVIIPIRKWQKLLSENIGKSYQIQIFRKLNSNWQKFPTITNFVSTDSIDPYLTYRFVPPAYDGYSDLNIRQRHLESFDCSDIINNSLTDGSCMNCHITNGGNPDEFVVHFRAVNPGTIIYKNGQFLRLNTATREFSHPGVYPSWHPSGRFIALATLRPTLYFHADFLKRAKVYDVDGNIALLDLETYTLLASPKLKTPDPMQETFPCWSPDGKWLYFCRSRASEGFDTIRNIEKYLNLRFDLLRIPFDEKNIAFGEIEMVVNVQEMDKSTSLPKISPDGRYLMFCITDFGTNPVWRSDSDLYLLDLQTFEWKPLTAVNSNDSESYHSWSSNSKWFVVSSKRRDGLVSLPYFSHLDSNGNASKPFLLPQKNPDFYDTWIKSFNVPELVKGKTTTNISDFEKAVKDTLINVRFGWTKDITLVEN
jgi:hypothetical protein